MPDCEHQRANDCSTRELKQLLISNKNTFLQGLTSTEFTDYPLWKTIKIIKQVKKYSTPLRTPERANIDKAHAFSKHLAKVFRHVPQKMNLKMKKHVSIFWKPPINSNHQSTANQHSQYL
jgi:hypothetical protein